MIPLILASTSAYRRELLHRLGLPFKVYSPDTVETAMPGEAPADTACRLALLKARAVSNAHPGAAVIGSDQVADLGGQTLGKPGTHDAATAQLRAMRGQTVLFHTAVSVVCQNRGFEATQLVSVSVQFRALSDAEIERYLRLEQPYDCAGSAKVEGLGIALLACVTSEDPTALIGLPLVATCTLLRQLGIDPLGPPRHALESDA